MKKNVFRIQTPIVLFSLSDDYINNITSFFSGGMSKNEILLTNRFKLSKRFQEHKNSNLLSHWTCLLLKRKFVRLSQNSKIMLSILMN
jgi:hypothetical protein